LALDAFRRAASNAVTNCGELIMVLLLCRYHMAADFAGTTGPPLGPVFVENKCAHEPDTAQGPL
jgi:hypothetical protein